MDGEATSMDRWELNHKLEFNYMKQSILLHKSLDKDTKIKKS